MPESIRAQPGRLTIVLDLPAQILPAEAPARASEAFRCAEVTAQQVADEASGLAWRVELEWRTAVLGTFLRHVTEVASLQLKAGPRGHQLVVTCEPIRTHDAHAAGAAAVLVLATCAWLLAGWSTIGVPVGLTTLLGGGTLVVLTRRMALQTLERRLRRLAEDVATAVFGPRSPLESPPHVEV